MFRWCGGGVGGPGGAIAPKMNDGAIDRAHRSHRRQLLGSLEIIALGGH